jgi:hypothetical protein
MEYMKTQVLKIDLIDESVEMREGQSDYIGSVRIPLRELIMHDEIADNFPIVDDKGHENGRMEVKLNCKDFDMNYLGASDLNNADGTGFTISKFIERDILTRIADKLATIPYEDMDLLFDFFLTPSEPNRIPKKHFKEVVLL